MAAYRWMLGAFVVLIVLATMVPVASATPKVDPIKGGTTMNPAQSPTMLGICRDRKCSRESRCACNCAPIWGVANPFAASPFACRDRKCSHALYWAGPAR